MATRSAHHTGHVSHRRSHARSRGTRSALLRFVSSRWRNLRALLRAVGHTHPVLRIVIILGLLTGGWLGANWTYHAVQKPTEVLFPLDNTLDKSPHETWRQYGSLFREHATPSVTPELLAALAQVEGAGNPVARTYWRWRWSWNPFEWYRPASSAVGMYQMTDGTFRAAKRYCVHDHAVVEDGPWHDPRSCWFNSLYSRVLPSHAIELTAASLDRDIASALRLRRGTLAGIRQRQDLAAVIHLCGAGAGRDFAARGFRLTPHQKCGDHDVATYLGHVRGLTQQFARWAKGATGQVALVKARRSGN
ncbi:MAG: transglycosylase SLT domain-containing protein [Nitrospira sp. CR2.1]|nr:transglycosylase SLT domain-containing protein [Nitrospira sp. CR2.1]